jgi:surfactin synthase thioesterase subunit
MTWFVKAKTKAKARVRLYCIPYAGAGATVYSPWASAIPGDIDVIGVQLPGKGRRMGEKPLTEMGQMADGIAEAILNEPPGPLGVFGHSMGSWLGLEVVKRLEAGGACPLCFFASGRQAPAVGELQPSISHLDDRAFVEAVNERYGGLPPEVLSNPEILATFLPVLRADFVALENARPDPSETIRTPVVGMVGRSDPNVSVEHMLPWSETTSGPFEVQVFSGGHFYFTDDPAPLHRKLTSILRTSLGAGAGDEPGGLGSPGTATSATGFARPG